MKVRNKLFKRIGAIVSAIVLTLGVGMCVLSTPKEVSVKAEERIVRRSVVTEYYEEYTLNELLSTYVQYSPESVGTIEGGNRRAYSRQTTVPVSSYSSVRYWYWSLKLPYDFMKKFGSYQLYNTFSFVSGASSGYSGLNMVVGNNENTEFIMVNNEKYPSNFVISSNMVQYSTSILSRQTGTYKFDWYDDDVDWVPMYVMIGIPAYYTLNGDNIKCRFFYGDSGSGNYYIGVQDGKDQVISNPNEFGLKTQAQYDAYGQYMFSEGASQNTDKLLQSGFWAIAAIPVNTISSMLNFNIGGFNLFPVFMTVISVLLASALLKVFL